MLPTDAEDETHKSRKCFWDERPGEEEEKLEAFQIQRSFNFTKGRDSTLALSNYN